MHEDPSFSKTLILGVCLPIAGVLNRGEISPMGEILGIQGGIESV